MMDINKYVVLMYHPRGQNTFFNCETVESLINCLNRWAKSLDVSYQELDKYTEIIHKHEYFTVMDLITPKEEGQE